MSAFPSHYYGIQERSQPTQPPSPPMDDSNSLKLPPIRSFFAVAGEGSSPTSETAPPRSPADSIFRPMDHGAQKAHSRPGSGHANTAPPSLSSGLPPTPPMSVDAFFETRMTSPSARSASHISTTPGPTGPRHETTPPMDDPLRRPYHRAPQPQAYIPGQAPIYHHAHPPAPPSAAAQQLYSHVPYQRALPQAFPPVTPQHYASPHNPHSAWQPTAHHHYLNPSQGPTYPQTQDRYICAQCSKAFSRPSSLRIHSHSHTGEKPFKCPHAGCGKAFSVRSNMKRHERGCHSFELSGGR